VQAARSGIPAILPRSHLRDWLYARVAAAAVLGLLYAATRHHQVYIWRLGSNGRSRISAPGAQVRSGFEWRFARHGEQATSIITRLMIALPMASNACEATRPSCTLPSSRSAG